MTRKRFFNQLLEREGVVVGRTELVLDGPIGKKGLPRPEVTLRLFEVRLKKSGQGIILLLLNATRILNRGSFLLIQGYIHTVFLCIVHDDTEMTLQKGTQDPGELQTR